MRYGQLVDVIELARELAGSGEQAYRGAPPRVRKLVNTCFLERIYVDEETTTFEHTEAYQALIDLGQRLQAEEEPGHPAEVAELSDCSRQRDRKNPDLRLVPVDRGSSKSLLVREEGLEPSHPYGHRHLKPARLPIPPLARGGS